MMNNAVTIVYLLAGAIYSTTSTYLPAKFKNIMFRLMYLSKYVQCNVRNNLEMNKILQTNLNKIQKQIIYKEYVCIRTINYERKSFNEK